MSLVTASLWIILLEVPWKSTKTQCLVLNRKNLHPFLTAQGHISLADLCTQLCFLLRADLPQLFVVLVYVQLGWFKLL